MNIIKSKYYYERKIPDDYFESIIVSEALLTKKDLRTKYMDIFADNIDHISKKQLKSVTSSGTTGEPITVYWSPVDLVKSNIELWRLRNQYYNITPLCKQISFDTGNMTLGSEIRMVDKYHMLINKFFVSEENMEQIYNAFVEYDPEWILVQPSLAIRIFDYFASHNLQVNKSLRYIEMNGEVLNTTVRKFISEFCGVQIANMYGCNEINAIAYECPYGHMHVVSGNVFVQLKDACVIENEITGNIVVTSKHNTSFPIVGYELNDRVTISQNISCPCHSSSLVITEIRGRESASATIGDNKVVDLRLVEACIEEVNYMLGNVILQYKEDYTKHKLIIYLKINDSYKGWKNIVKTELENRFSKPLEIEKELISIIFIDNYPNLLPSGKLH